MLRTAPWRCKVTTTEDMRNNKESAAKNIDRFKEVDASNVIYVYLIGTYNFTKEIRTLNMKAETKSTSLLDPKLVLRFGPNSGHQEISHIHAHNPDAF